MDGLRTRMCVCVCVCISLLYGVSYSISLSVNDHWDHNSWTSAILITWIARVRRLNMNCEISFVQTLCDKVTKTKTFLIGNVWMNFLYKLLYTIHIITYFIINLLLLGDSCISRTFSSKPNQKWNVIRKAWTSSLHGQIVSNVALNIQIMKNKNMWISKIRYIIIIIWNRLWSIKPLKYRESFAANLFVLKYIYTTVHYLNRWEIFKLSCLLLPIFTLPISNFQQLQSIESINSYETQVIF